MARTIVKRVKNAILYDDGCVRIDNVRASYPHIDKPFAGKGEDGKPAAPKFSIKGLGDKKTHNEVKNLCVEIIDKLCKDKQLGKLGADKKFIRNGDDMSGEENEGMWVFSASENPDRRPSVRAANGSVIDQDEIASVIYPGCYVNILIRPWAQNNSYGKRINANLIAVQFARDGERIGEAPIDDEGVFDEVEDAMDEEDDGGL